MLNRFRKGFGKQRLSWATDTHELPDFGLSTIEVKLVAALVIVQTLVLALLLL